MEAIVCQRTAWHIIRCAAEQSDIICSASYSPASHLHTSLVTQHNIISLETCMFCTTVLRILRSWDCVPTSNLKIVQIFRLQEHISLVPRPGNEAREHIYIEEYRPGLWHTTDARAKGASYWSYNLLAFRGLHPLWGMGVTSWSDTTDKPPASSPFKDG